MSQAAEPQRPLQQPSIVAELAAQAAQHGSWHDGRQVVWRCWGTGVPVVLLHGGGGSWKHWIRNIQPLARSHAVWAPDLPGYGDSDAPPEPVSFDDLASAVERGVRTLLPADQPLHLVGFSLGAHVAARVADRLGDRVARLVLVGTNFVDDTGPVGQAVVQWKKAREHGARLAALRHNLHAIMLFDPVHLDDEALAIYADDVTRQRVRPAAFVGRRSLREELAGLAPTLQVVGISGVLDQVFAHVRDRQAQALSNLRPGGAFHFVDGGGHWVMYEAADRFNVVLVRVLDEPIVASTGTPVRPEKTAGRLPETTTREDRTWP